MSMEFCFCQSTVSVKTLLIPLLQMAAAHWAGGALAAAFASWRECAANRFVRHSTVFGLACRSGANSKSA